MAADERKNNPGPGPVRTTALSGKGATGPYEIPPEGSLGLLAMGAIGITEWRHARDGIRGPQTGSGTRDDAERESEEVEEDARDPRLRGDDDVRLRGDDDSRGSDLSGEKTAVEDE